MRISKVFVSVALILSSLTVAKAEYPERPIRLVVPYPPGGLVDIMARIIQAPLTAALGQPVIIENKSGAAGAIAALSVAQSNPDGYTLFFGNTGPNALLPLLQKDVGYDPIKDFSPISRVATAPMILVVHKSVPANDLQEFIAYAKANPGKVEFASAGIGSLGHLTSEMFAQMANVKLLHVPYRGSAPAVTAMLTGEVKMYLSSMSDVLSDAIKSGTLRLLGVSTAAPSDLVPGAPPIGNTLANFDASIWYGVWAPRGTPSTIVMRLNKVLRAALTEPEVQDRFRANGAIASASSPEELAKLVADEIPKWRVTIDATQ